MRKLTYLSSLLLMFVLPWEDSISLPGLGSLVRLAGFMVAGLWFVTIVIEGRFRKPNRFHVLVLVFFLWNFLTLFWSSDLQYPLQRIRTYSQIFLLLLIYWDIYRKPEDLLAGWQAYIFGAYVLIGSTLSNYLTGNVAVEYEGRYSATGVNANDVALILILGMPFGLFIVMQRGCVPWKKSIAASLTVLNILYVPLSIFAIILTGSRTSLIAVVPFIVYIMTTQRISLQQKTLIVTFVLVAILALLPFAPQTLLYRISTIGSSIRDADMGGRVVMWQKSIAVFAEHPVLGVGSGIIDHMIGGAVHNTLISVAAETGLIGLTLFLAITGLAVYAVFKLPRSSSGLWLAIFTIWAIGAFSLSWEFRKLTWILLNFIMIESEPGKEPAGVPVHTNSLEGSNAEIHTTNSFYDRAQKGQGRRFWL